MINIAHKYVRRFIGWLNKPSQEEIDAKALRWADMRAENSRIHLDCLRTSVLQAINYKPLPGAYSAYGLADLRFCAGIIREACDSGLCSKELATSHLAAVSCIGGKPALVAA